MAVDFDGTSYLVTAGNQIGAAIDPLNEVTFTFWMRADNEAYTYIFIQKDASNANIMHVRTNLTPFRFERTFDDDGGASQYRNYNYAGEDVWLFVCVTASIEGDYTKMYINITSTDTHNCAFNAGSTWQTPGAGKAFSIAGDYGANLFNGAIEDFRIYNRVLSDSELKSIYYGRGVDDIIYGAIVLIPMREKPAGTTIANGDVKDLRRLIIMNQSSDPAFTAGPGLSSRRRCA